MPERSPEKPLPAVPLADQSAEVERELALRRNVYRAQVASGKLTPETARLQLDRMRAVARTLRALAGFDAAIIPVLSAMGYAVDVGEEGELPGGEPSEDEPPGGEPSGGEPARATADVPASEPPPSDGLDGSEPIGPGQIGELQALLVDHGWDRETTLELLSSYGWERLAEIPHRKLGLVQQQVTDPHARATIAERVRQRDRRAAAA